MNPNPLKQEIISLLIELHDYMSNKADVDGDSEGFSSNTEAKFQNEISNILYRLGEKDFGDSAYFSTKPDSYKPHEKFNEPLSESKVINKKKNKVVRLTENDLSNIVLKTIRNISKK